jgi:hypothetical protein
MHIPANRIGQSPEDYDSNGAWDDSDPGPTENPVDRDHPDHTDDANPWAPGVRASDIPVVPRTKPLVPNRTDISAHLYALFSPAFVQPYPDAWIEIAFGRPDGDLNAAETFSVFDLEKAVEFAESKNRDGYNLYVGAAMRHGERSKTGRASGHHVLAASNTWAEFDGAGDAERIDEILTKHKLAPAMVVTTGTTPHLRAHLYFRLKDAGTPEKLEAANTALYKLLGSDAVQNPDRVMRLAGTVNYPKPKKQERGYIAERVTLKIVADARAYQADELIKLAPTEGATSDGFAGAKNGRADGELEALLKASQVKEWHTNMRAAVATMVGRRWSDLQIRLACAAYCTGGADDPDMAPLIRGARSKWNKPDNDTKDAPATGDEPAREGVSLGDFYALMPSHSYIFTPSREMWPASSVNSRIPPIPAADADGKQKAVSASIWLDQNKPVEQMTWAPGLPMLIRNRLIAEGEWIERDGVSCFNLYRPPAIKPGDATKAGPWIDHVHKVFGDDAPHIVQWLAHWVQRPQEKINHALVLGGCQGIGKDTLLEPVKQAIGPWNFSEASPQQMLGRFNGFLKSVILRVSEARDLGDVDRFKFYDHMKSYTAAPPDVLRVDEKHLREHSVLNVCGVIITSNHKTDGIYLPADDRRHFVAWSDLVKEDFTAAYWNKLWGWYADGGNRHVAAYLASLDIRAFDPKAPPPKTAAFWDIVDASQAPEDAELADVLDRMGNPEATTLIRITAETRGEIETWIKDRKNRRAIPHRLEKCGYIPIRNDASKQGLWVINDTRQTIYAKSSLSIRDRLKAASSLIAGM